MDKLKFYNIDLEYVKYLQEIETKERGFSRVPNMEYFERKSKFLCGVVLQVNGFNYYVPVSSYKKQQPNNFLIKAETGNIVSSLRFNYMFPVPKKLLTVKDLNQETDYAYRRLLYQELRYCIKNQDTIKRLAQRTYKRVLLGKDLVLIKNSCDFLLLEKHCQEYMQTHKMSLNMMVDQASKKAENHSKTPVKNKEYEHSI